MRWIPWIVLGVLAASVGLIFTKSSQRGAPDAKSVANHAASGTASKASGSMPSSVAPASFAAPAEASTSRRKAGPRAAAMAAYNQEATGPVESVPGEAGAAPAVDPAVDPAVPGQNPPVDPAVPAQQPAADVAVPAADQGKAQASDVPAPGDVSAPSDAAPAAQLPPPPANAINPLPAPRSNDANNDDRPLSNLTPPAGAEASAGGLHDSAHQPYYPATKPHVTGPLPRRNTDAWEAIHRKAAMKAEMRGRRLSTQKWFGYSNLRPTASATPFQSTYSPAWTSNSAHPSHWMGVR